MSSVDLSKIAIRLAVGRRVSPFSEVAWSPDNGSIAAAGKGGDGLVWLWRLDQSEPIRLEGHRGAVTSIAWSPDGASLASGSYDKTVRVWDAASAQPRFVLERHQTLVTQLGWSLDSRVLDLGR